MRITVQEAIRLLRDGKVIAIPTDTVYGLAADASNPEAVDQIFAIKKRPNHKPLITLIAEQTQINPFVHDFPPDFDRLVKHFWPGALTLVIPIKPQTIHKTIRAGLENAGFRIPNHPVTLQLLKQFGPVVAPSANLSGLPAAISPEQIEKDFGEEFPILEGEGGGDPRDVQGLESTILCYQHQQGQGRWHVVRLGAISLLQIEEVLGYLPLT